MMNEATLRVCSLSCLRNTVQPAAAAAAAFQATQAACKGGVGFAHMAAAAAAQRECRDWLTRHGSVPMLKVQECAVAVWLH